MSDSDSLFGDVDNLGDRLQPVSKRICLDRQPDLFANSSAVKIVKLPPKTLLSADLWNEPQQTASIVQLPVPHLAWRTVPGSTEIQSNVRLVEWEDGSFTLMVGNDGFKVLERVEDVHVYDRTVTESNDESEILVLSGVAKKQMILTPASLDSRTKTTDTVLDVRKTQITSAQKLDALLQTQAVSMTQTAKPTASSRAMTAAFLEEEQQQPAATSIRAIKRSYKSVKKTQSQSVESASSESSSASSESDSSSDSSESSSLLSGE